jgi:hypothetical protein
VTYTASSIGSTANPASALVTALDPLLTAAGFTFVEQWTSANITARVYKSPAASNTQGADWYLSVYRASDSNTQLQFSVAEVWDTGTKKFRNYAPSTTSLTPVAVTFAVNDATGVLPNGVISRPGPTLSTAGFQYWLSANPNRVVLGTRVSVTDYGIYAGLYDDLWNTTISPFPLAVVDLAGANAQSFIGGSATREPNQAGVAVANFGVQIPTVLLAVTPAWTPMIAGEIYTGSLKQIPSRVLLTSARAGGLGQLQGMRGLLKDMVATPTAAANGDTLAVTDSAGATASYVKIGGGSTIYTWADTSV